MLLSACFIGSGGGTRTPDTRIMIPGGLLFLHGFLVNRHPNPPLHIKYLPKGCKPLGRRKRRHCERIPSRSGSPTLSAESAARKPIFCLARHGRGLDSGAR